MSEFEKSQNNEVDADGEPIKGTTRFQLLLRIGAVVVFFLVTLGVIGWFLPSEYTVSTEIEINAPANEVYGMLERADLWPLWSPSWDFEANDKIAYNYHIEFTGVTWSHNDMIGNKHIGKMWMNSQTKKANERLDYVTERGENRAENSFELESLDPGRTRLTWTTHATLPRKGWTDGLFYGWAGLLFNGNLKAQYDSDLVRLKEVCESSVEMTNSVNQDSSETPSF